MARSWPVHVYLLELKKLSSYRVDFWMRLVIAALVRIFLAYYLWDALFRESKASTIGGYSFQDMLAYYVLAAFVGNLIFSSIDRFGSEIYNGTLTRYLLYPVSFYLYQCATAFAYFTLCMIQLLLGLVITIFFLGGMDGGLALNPISVVIGCLTCFLAAYNYLLLQTQIELAAFWVEGVWGLMVALYFIVNFLGGALLPLTLFPMWLQELLRYSPFPYLISFPVEVFLGKLTAGEILRGVCVSLFWTAALSWSASKIWARGLRRYSGVGI